MKIIEWIKNTYYAWKYKDYDPHGIPGYDFEIPGWDDLEDDRYYSE